MENNLKPINKKRIAIIVAIVVLVMATALGGLALSNLNNKNGAEGGLFAFINSNKKNVDNATIDNQSITPTPAVETTPTPTESPSLIPTVSPSPNITPTKVAFTPTVVSTPSNQITTKSYKVDEAEFEFSYKSNYTLSKSNNNITISAPNNSKLILTIELLGGCEGERSATVRKVLTLKNNQFGVYRAQPGTAKEYAYSYGFGNEGVGSKTFDCGLFWGTEVNRSAPGFSSSLYGKITGNPTQQNLDDFDAIINSLKPTYKTFTDNVLKAGSVFVAKYKVSYDNAYTFTKVNNGFEIKSPKSGAKLVISIGGASGCINSGLNHTIQKKISLIPIDDAYIHRIQNDSDKTYRYAGFPESVKIGDKTYSCSLFYVYRPANPDNLVSLLGEIQGKPSDEDLKVFDTVISTISIYND